MTVDVYIWEQSEPVKSILDYVHHLALHHLQEVEFTMKWHVPYYTVHGPLFYLNPIKKHTAVEVCFARARKFVNGQEHLDYKKRKIVGGFTIKSLENVDENILVSLIKESLATDLKYKGIRPWKL